MTEPPMDRPDNIKEIRIWDGRLWVWDDSPEWEPGQFWIAVCFWCKNGPLDKADGMMCPKCLAKGKGPQPNKTRVLSVRLTENEFINLQDAAKLIGVSTSEFIRKYVLAAVLEQSAGVVEWNTQGT